jgi:PKD repeat protein
VDNENNTVISQDELPAGFIPTMTVTNGPNKAPIAKFNVDRTSIFVGESINFVSSSNDPDGKIVAYFWDWEGDGFANNNKDEGPNVTKKFEKSAPNGIRIRLKVKDNNESETVSDPITIYIDSLAEPPKAAFTFKQDGTSKKVRFTNNSTADEAHNISIAKYSWDFDVNEDADGDGIKDNDVESTEKEPVFEYEEYGIKRVRLTVEDSEKQISSVTNFVNVKAPVSTTQSPTVELDARLLTVPAVGPDGKVHIKGDAATVKLDFSSSVGNISKYIIDKNIFFDSNGNGIKDDDIDYTTNKSGSFITTFTRAAGNARVRLTVVDTAGNKDTVEKDIVFD